MKVNIGKISIIALVFVSVLGLLTYSSYLYSKRTAIQFVGESIQYFPLKNSFLTILPIQREQPGWGFRFLHFKTTEDFEVYTNLLGQIEITFPRRDIGNLLREYEKRKVHPYSLEGLKELYGPIEKNE